MTPRQIITLIFAILFVIFAILCIFSSVRVSGTKPEDDEAAIKKIQEYHKMNKKNKRH